MIENVPESQPIMVSELVTGIKRKFNSDYGRKSDKVLRNDIQKAVDAILRENGVKGERKYFTKEDLLDKVEVHASDSESFDVELGNVEKPTTNSMNKMLIKTTKVEEVKGDGDAEMKDETTAPAPEEKKDEEIVVRPGDKRKREEEEKEMKDAAPPKKRMKRSDKSDSSK